MVVLRIVFFFTLSTASRIIRRSRHKGRSKTHENVVLTPADGDAYLQALSTTNRFCPVRCASEIIQPSSTEELAAWLRANQGTPFTVKGGGHSYGCQSVPEDGGVLIHTARLNEQRVFRRPDGTAYVRAGSGLTFDEIVPRMAKLNYSMPHGECMTVGMGGWNLNIGNHPELKNFDNKWGYDGKPFLNKATFVNYQGTIFSVTKDGFDLVELGKESWFTWQSRALLTKAKAAALNLASPDLVASGNVMKAFKVWGASLAIATEFEIELLTKPEPGFFQVTYAISDVLNDKGGRGQQLMKAIIDVVDKGGANPDVDCGIYYASGYFQGSKEGVVALKCTDWASPTGDSVRRVAPAGYRKLEPKKSGFLFWTHDSYGKGWVPMWHAEQFETFLNGGGSDKYRDFLRSLDGANPCDACSSELMFMGPPAKTPHVMIDMFCSARRSNQDACAAFAFGIKKIFNGNRTITYKQNLPSCAANSNWKSEMVEYGGGGWALGRMLKGSWDPNNAVDYWLGLGTKVDNGAECEAGRSQPVGETCQRHGISWDDLAEAERAKVRTKCPSFARHDDFESQNTLCAQYVYDTATAPGVTEVSA